MTLSFFFFFSSSPAAGGTSSRIFSDRGQRGNINWRAIPCGWNSAHKWNDNKLFICLIRRHVFKLFSQTRQLLCSSFFFPLNNSTSIWLQLGPTKLCASRNLIKMWQHNDEMTVFRAAITVRNRKEPLVTWNWNVSCAWEGLDRPKMSVWICTEPALSVHKLIRMRWG